LRRGSARLGWRTADARSGAAGLLGGPQCRSGPGPSGGGPFADGHDDEDDRRDAPDHGTLRRTTGQDERGDQRSCGQHPPFWGHRAQSPAEPARAEPGLVSHQGYGAHSASIARAGRRRAPPTPAWHARASPASTISQPEASPSRAGR
jgi:hypothetical protein